MDAKQLYEQLKKLQEPKGYYFNKDMDLTLALLEGLLDNKKTYGYMACPCRLANGTFADDKDIICPCPYREPDVEEYGACFCGLYVNPQWSKTEGEHDPVPERRPPENIKF